MNRMDSILLSRKKSLVEVTSRALIGGEWKMGLQNDQLTFVDDGPLEGGCGWCKWCG